MSHLSFIEKHKPHAVCIPYPAQGHINPMFQLAKLLHFKGFHITFVNTEFNHKRLLKSRGPNALDGIPSFRFETIPDGLAPTHLDATQDIPSLCDSTSKNCLPYFQNLLSKMIHNSSNEIPPISCIVSDGSMSFTLNAAQEFGVPEVVFWTVSACGFMCYLHYHQLVQKGLTPLKDASYLTNGYLETEVDLIPGLKGIRLKDIPSFIRTTNPNDIMLNYLQHEAKRTQRASAIILNTFDALERQVLDAFKLILSPPVYSIGPLQLLLNEIPDDNDAKSLGSNLWKEEPECLQWLDKKEPNSVLYVNFGSITMSTKEQMIEFAWGLVNSGKTFLWVIRPDLVAGEKSVVPTEFVDKTKDRGFLASWCPQKQVLRHPAIGGFLTHSGWNSTIESICGGVPMICWPFFAEQQTNCRFSCSEWGIGMEIESDVKRDEIERMVRELMEGDKGKEMKKMAMHWKYLAEEAANGPYGSSFKNLDTMINRLLLSRID